MQTTELAKIAFHPIASIFPLMQGEELDALKASIGKGYDAEQPVILFEGMILDGRNRYTAAKDLGVEPTFREWSGTFVDAVDWVWQINFDRRHLTSSQKACCIAERDELLGKFREEAAERKSEAIAESNKKRASRQDELPLSQQIDSMGSDRNGSKADTQVAKLAGTNRQYVADARKLRETAPESFDAIKRGEKTITEVKREQKEQARETRRQENQKKIVASSEKRILIPSDARFATIVIDPPWDWGDEGDCDQLGRARPEYQTMTFDQLKSFEMDGRKFSDHADVDCHLYLWITNRSLPKGFALMDAWGFRYVTCVTWCKPHFGMGNYFRGQTEHLLFGVRGSQQLKRKDVGTCFTAARGPGGHSSKPDESYRLIESCSPGPYLEVFSRAKRDGWTVWGGEL